MIITPVAHGLDLAHSFGPPRSPGTHMSDLYGSYYAALEPERYGKKVDERGLPVERWGLGMAFEDMLEEGLKQRAITHVLDTRHEEIERPEPLLTEHAKGCTRPRVEGVGCVCGGNVRYSPDLFILNGGLRVGEIKLNSMSAKGAPWELGATYSSFDRKFDKYFCQLKLYCLHVGTLAGRLYSFSVREMVYFNEDLIFRAWDVDFDQQELEEEWEVVKNHSIHEGLLV